MVSSSTQRKEAGHAHFLEPYKSYKESYVKLLRFDPGKPNLSRLFFTKADWHICILAGVIEHAQLEEVVVFFDTATYDQIERDVKVMAVMGECPKSNQ